MGQAVDFGLEYNARKVICSVLRFPPVDILWFNKEVHCEARWGLAVRRMSECQIREFGG